MWQQSAMLTAWCSKATSLVVWWECWYQATMVVEGGCGRVSRGGYILPVKWHILGPNNGAVCHKCKLELRFPRHTPYLYPKRREYVRDGMNMLSNTWALNTHKVGIFFKFIVMLLKDPPSPLHPTKMSLPLGWWSAGQGWGTKEFCMTCVG